MYTPPNNGDYLAVANMLGLFRGLIALKFKIPNRTESNGGGVGLPPYLYQSVRVFSKDFFVVWFVVY